MNREQRYYEWGIADDRATMAMAMAMRDPNPIHHSFAGAHRTPPIVQGPVVWGVALEAAANWFPNLPLQSASARFLKPVQLGQILIARHVDREGGGTSDSRPGTVSYEVHTSVSVEPVVSGEFLFESDSRQL